MSLDVNLQLEKALDLGWQILSSCFKKEQVGLKNNLINNYWKDGAS
jgi:V/A-type H+-transporting ATPase subunit B